MTKQIRRLIEDQAKVVAHTHDANADKVWFVTLAAAFAGVFYFYAYYFWGNGLWRVLTGG
jgi:hypothetical protein